MQFFFFFPFFSKLFLLGIIIRSNSELRKEKRNNTPCLLRVLANSPSWVWTTFQSFSPLIATYSSDGNSHPHPPKRGPSSFLSLPHQIDEGFFIIVSYYFVFIALSQLVSRVRQGDCLVDMAPVAQGCGFAGGRGHLQEQSLALVTE